MPLETLQAWPCVQCAALTERCLLHPQPRALHVSVCPQLHAQGPASGSPALLFPESTLRPRAQCRKQGRAVAAGPSRLPPQPQPRPVAAPSLLLVWESSFLFGCVSRFPVLSPPPAETFSLH